jgi:hypothetical protein
MAIQSDLPPRIDRALAELEFDLWEALVNGEIEPNVDLKFNFKIRHKDGQEESVDVTVAIRK